MLALLGAWIAILQTNAATNESSSAREATRLASEAQTARIVDDGIGAALDEIDSEIELFASRPAFNIDESAAADVGATVDPERTSRTAWRRVRRRWTRHWHRMRLGWMR